MGAQCNHTAVGGGNEPRARGAEARVRTPCRAPEPVKSIPLGVLFERPKMVLRGLPVDCHGVCTRFRRPERTRVGVRGVDTSEGSNSHMPRQQERARRTRSAIVRSAAAEFAKRGYAAASISSILEHSNTTKGAMYFHFTSKEELARAVLDEGLDHYREIVGRWAGSAELDPFERLYGLVTDLGSALHDDVVIAAEFRLVTEPEFAREAQLRGGHVWGRAGYALATEARRAGLFREGVDVRRFVEAVASSLAGQRYLVDLTSETVDVGERFAACLEVPLEAMASQEWLDLWHRRGWSRVKK